MKINKKILGVIILVVSVVTVVGYMIFPEVKAVTKVFSALDDYKAEAESATLSQLIPIEFDELHLDKTYDSSGSIKVVYNGQGYIFQKVKSLTLGIKIANAEQYFWYDNGMKFKSLSTEIKPVKFGAWCFGQVGDLTCFAGVSAFN